MDRLFLQRSGPVRGVVSVSGAKNAVLPIMAACLLTDEPSVIERVPRVTDVDTMAEILRRLGADARLQDERLTVTPGPAHLVAPYELVSKMRASICVLGPLLARHGKARVSMPGGCVLGSRPIDLHLKGLQALGASLTLEHGDIVAETRGLRGTRVHLGGTAGSSVLATDNVMMAAVLAHGTTVIEHAACEPEVVDLAECLIQMGAKISGHGGPVIRIDGVARLRGAAHQIIPDRIEAGTFLIAAGLLGGDLIIEGGRREHLDAVIDKLAEAGVTIDPVDGGLRVRAGGRPLPVEVTTQPFPGFPTDLQAPISAMLSLGQGVSVVTEKIYPERFQHVSELNRMGAAIAREGSTAIIKGVERLSGAPVVASDLRAGAALVLAGLAAENETEVTGLEHLDRGYEGLERKLVSIGAQLRRVSDPPGAQEPGLRAPEEETKESRWS